VLHFVLLIHHRLLPLARLTQLYSPHPLT